MRMMRLFSNKASVFPGYVQHLALPLELPQDFQAGARQAYQVLLQRLVDFEFDCLKDLTELTFSKHLKKKVSLLVEDGLELTLVGSAEESEVCLVSATTHIGAVLPFRNLNPSVLRFEVEQPSGPHEFRYKYRPISKHPMSFAKFCLRNLSRLNQEADLSEFEPELDHLYSLLNIFPQVIHRRTVEINTSLRLKVFDSKQQPVGGSPEKQLHRLTFEMLEKGRTTNTDAATWFEKNLEEVSGCWLLVDVDECMAGNSLIRYKES